MYADTDGKPIVSCFSNQVIIKHHAAIRSRVELLVLGRVQRRVGMRRYSHTTRVRQVVLEDERSRLDF